MTRKVIIDADPGIDDAVALCLALFAPELEVLALTATGGNVPLEQAGRNIQAILDMVDPPRLPRFGHGTTEPTATGTDARHFHGKDGLGNLNLPVSELHHQHAAEKIISDEVAAAEDDVTLITLGPLTNIAAAFRVDPELPSRLDQLIIVGGSVGGVGNVTPAAEFNMYCDPGAAAEVFRSPVTKTLIPLDVTRQVEFGFDLLEQLPDETTPKGKFLRDMLPFYFRAYHQHLGRESIYLHDAVGLLFALQPDLFTTEEMAGDVETQGELTAGATIFDRRALRDWRDNMEVAVEIKDEIAKESIVAGLASL